MFRSIAILTPCLVGLLLSPLAGSAAVVEINQTITLRQSQIYNCLTGFGVVQSRCWGDGRVPSGQFVYPSFPETTLGAGDTLRIVATFADGYRLRWSDDGLSFPTYGDEFFQVTAALKDSFAVQADGSFFNSLSFTQPSGSLLNNNSSWTWDGSSGGLIVASWSGGPTNLTNSYFEFSGYTAEFKLLSGTGVPTNLDYFATTFGSGVFSIIAPVPVPAAVWLFGSALGVMGWMRRKVREKRDV